MQSGITVSEELASQFSDFLNDTSTFGLLVTINKESLVPVTKLPSTSSDFHSNLAGLTPHVKPDEALYALLRRFDSAPSLIAVTYVPDAAKVRQKMLFASTRLTLTRELGGEHFRDNIFTTVADELTPAGFDKYDKHQKMDAPLTEEERTLGEIKRAEAEAGRGTGVKEIHLSNHMNMPLNTEALEKLKEFGQKGSDLVMLEINKQTEVIELVPSSAKPSSIKELVQAISPSEPRFTFYRFTHEHEGAESSPVLFFYTSPAQSGAKAIKYRMMYPLMKRAVLTVADKEAAIPVDKKFEVEDPSEITEDSVMEELHPKPQVKTGFKRPKRPGR